MIDAVKKITEIVSSSKSKIKSTRNHVCKQNVKNAAFQLSYYALTSCKIMKQQQKITKIIISPIH